MSPDPTEPTRRLAHEMLLFPSEELSTFSGHVQLQGGPLFRRQTRLGARLGTVSVPATAAGYRKLVRWADAYGAVHAFGIEGTGSYGAGLSRALNLQGRHVIEVDRPNRRLRRQQGKSDAIDAEAAARAVLTGQAHTRPKSGDGEVEMIRHLKIVRDTAMKARSQAMVTLKTLLVNAPQLLREQFIAVTGPMTLIRALAALRPGPVTSTTASARKALRMLTDIGASMPSPRR